jgi:hypothetical protein
MGQPRVDEAAFQRWYAEMARRFGLDANPDGQFYDYRAAFAAGAEPDESEHWPSQFKQSGHPNEIVGGFNTRTGTRVKGTPRAFGRDLLDMGWDEGAVHDLDRIPEPGISHPDFQRPASSSRVNWSRLFDGSGEHLVNRALISLLSGGK